MVIEPTLGDGYEPVLGEEGAHALLHLVHSNPDLPDDGCAITWRDLDLVPHHAQVLVHRGISPSVAHARGVSSVSRPEQLADLGYAPSQQNVPALVIPMHNAAGEPAGTLIRPDYPRMNERGRPVKYEAAAGSRMVVDVPLPVRQWIRDDSVPLFVTEGPLKADAAASHGLCCVALQGVWGFKGKTSADFDLMALKGREVYLVFDSDLMEKRQVYQALERLRAMLQHYHARTHIIYLPAGENGAKTGLDDYLVRGRSVEKLLAHAQDDLRPFTDGEAGPYRMSESGITLTKVRGQEVSEVLLSNFPARIIERLVLDNATGHTTDAYVVETLVEGHRRRVVVPVEQFDGMRWVSQLGPRAILMAGMSAKDHARAAIQFLSDDIVCTQVYTHAGFTVIDGEAHYLTSSGALGPNGLVPQVQVQLPPEIKRFSLPEPPPGDQLKLAVRKSLGLLELAPGRVTATLLALVYRAPLGGLDCSVHLYGHTGSGKTQLAILCQQHWGAGLDARHIPGSWESTANANESLLHAAKDCVCVIDDFLPVGSQADIQRRNREADRLMRGMGNATGRARMTADGRIIPARVPRAALLSTGEECPRGHSLAARRVDVELVAGVLNWDLLTSCQKAGNGGVLAAAMAGYVQYLARNYEEIMGGREDELICLRDEVSKALRDHHRRDPNNIAQLALGWRWFLRFAVSVGAITAVEHQALWVRVWKGLLEAATAQAEQQSENDPVLRYLTILRAALAAGEAHLAARDGTCPERPGAAGWREDHKLDWSPNGKRIGWIDGNDVFLEPEAAYATVKRWAEQAGNGLTIEQLTLRKRLKERGYLKRTDEARKKNTVRSTLEGKRRDVLHLDAEVLWPADAEPGEDTPSC